MSRSTNNVDRYLLDTNVVVALHRGDHAVRVAVERAGEVYLSATVVGELYYGALYSSSPARNVARVAGLAGGAVVLPCDAETAVVYGEIKSDLRRRGRMIPDNDVWIAAAAVQHGLTLVTRDAHFAMVAALSRAAW